MSYPKFITFNILGALFWAVGVPLLGYWLGSTVPSIDRYLLPIIALIVLVSILPGILHMLREPEQRRGILQWIRKLFRRK